MDNTEPEHGMSSRRHYESPQNTIPDDLYYKWTTLSAHGIQRVYRRRHGNSLIFSYIWLLTILLAGTAMIGLGYSVIKEYNTETTTTSVTFVPRIPVFPEVYICNRVIFDPEKIRRDRNSGDELVQVLADYADGNKTSYNLSDKIIRNSGPLFYSSYSMDFAQKYSLDITDFAIRCTVFITSSKNCSDMFQATLIPDIGLCYHLQPEYAEMVNNPGRFAAIDVDFYFSPEKNFGQLTANFGVIVLIGTKHNEFKQESIPVNPGEMLEIGVSKVSWRQKTSGSVFPCAKDEDVNKKLYRGRGFTRKYSHFACLTQCLNEAAYAMNNCYAYAGFHDNETCMDDPVMRRKAIQFFTDGYTTEQEKIKYFTELTLMDECQEKCYRPCNDPFYERTVSIIRPFPTSNALLGTLKTVLNDGNSNDSLSRSLLEYITHEDTQDSQKQRLEEIGKSVAHISIFQKVDRNEKVIELVPMYTFASFLSNVGGSMGLWLGISVISLIELFDCIISTLIALCRQWYRRASPKLRKLFVKKTTESSYETSVQYMRTNSANMELSKTVESQLNIITVPEPKNVIT